ncbi:interleukin-2 isoform X1 [Rousettus aegyptiacus]|uniref:Interleukin-2 n=2 Tax=Rousettus TaxID=9406 RepID=A0A7J8BSG4_ROUAE|nr:interleukin-2 isoform X1 [Rousettus aegyptiacus]KAF6401230.1 interleukin 2 [Rousettus aegyptiacus]BAH02558.1 interleukin-2 [Rousettus leschenaultii]
MHKMYFLSCIALTLALVADGAPTSSSRKETQQQLEHLLKDLQLLLNTVNNSKKHELSSMLTFKFHMPKATELKHLQCLVDELKPLEEVLTIAQSKNSHSKIKELVSNINVTAQKLKGPETKSTCDYDDDRVTVREFLNNWITFCQSIFSTLP